MPPAPAFADNPIALLTTVSILLAAALVRRTLRASGASSRWLSASAGLVGVVSVWLLADGLRSEPALASALERMYGVCLAAVAVWAGLRRPAAWTDGVLAVSLVLAALVFLSGVAFPPPPPLEASWVDLAWTVLSMLTAGFGLASIAAFRPRFWPALAAGLIVLLLGQVGHALTPPAFNPGAASISFAHAIATPLLVIAGIAQLVEAAPAPAAYPGPADGRAFREWDLLSRLLTADDPDSFASALTGSVAAWAPADVCLLLTPPDPDGSVRIGAGSGTPGALLPSARFGPGEIPVILQAFALGRSVVLPPGSHAPDLVSLQRALGRSERSTALVVPLVAEDGPLAGLVLLSRAASEGWSEAIRQDLEDASTVWAGRLAELSGRPRPMDAAGKASADLDRAMERIAELEAMRESARDPLDELVGTDDLRRRLDESQQEIEILQAETRRLATTRSTARSASEDPEKIQAELTLALRALAEARMAAQSEAASQDPEQPPSARVVASIQAARQPLTAIAGYTDLLLNQTVGLLGSSQRIFLQRIRTAVRRMDSELDELTGALGRLGSRDQAEIVDLGEALEKALERVHPVLRAKSLGIRLDLPPTSTSVAGDPAALHELLTALLRAAVEQAPLRQEILVSLLADSGEGVAVITLSDHGPASRTRPASERPRGPTEPPPGAAEPPETERIRSLAERLSGRVWVDRSPDGTTFSVLLPSS